jgi:hypothetical protein
MTEVQLIRCLIVLVLLVASYFPVNACIGRKTETLLGMYLATLLFRGLCILGSFFNGARQEILFSIILAVVIEVSILVRMSMAEKQAEVLA